MENNAFDMNAFYVAIISGLKEQKKREPGATERGRLLDVAIQQTILGQSWAMKAVDYKNPPVEGSINKGVN